MNDSIAVLLIEDDPAHAHLVRRYLAASAEPKFDLQWVDRLGAGLEQLTGGGVDVVLLDLGLPDSDPGATLPRVLEAAPDMPVVVLTTTEDPEQAVEAVKAGAQDHLPKPRVNADLLARAVRYAIERKRSERELRHLNETLEHRVAERSEVAERRAQTARRLAAKLGEAERRERRRLAQLLHDDLQQIIVAARMRLDLLATQLDKPANLETVRGTIRLLEQALDAARDLTIDLSPPILNESGLGAGLEWLARRMEEQHNLHVEVSSTGDPRCLTDDTGALLFEVSRELLFNVVKHAKVDRAQIFLDCTTKDAATLTVTDHGVGFDTAVLTGPGAAAGHFGLFSIRERLEAIGGAMAIESHPDRGTQVILRAPCTTEETDADAAALASPEGTAPDDASERNGRAPDTAQPEGRVRVLLVDDHRVVREGLAAAIAAERDLELVGQADSGEAALSTVLSQPVDVVVMDISMPGLGGIETTRQLKLKWPDVQVVGLSMHDPADTHPAMHAAGVFASLSKSGPLHALLDTIRRAHHAQSKPARSTRTT